VKIFLIFADKVLKRNFSAIVKSKMVENLLKERKTNIAEVLRQS